MTSTTTTRSTTHPRLTDIPLRHALNTMTLTDAVEALHGLDAAFAVIPHGYHPTLDATIVAISTAAGHLGLARVTDMLDDIEQLLRYLTPVGKIGAHLPTDIAEPLHRYRNTIATLALSAAASFAKHPELVHAAIPRLAARTTAIGRPFTGDEILLMRVDAATAPGQVHATVYALADTGLVNHEISSVTPDHLDDPQEPWALIAPGTTHLQSRHLQLDMFSNRMIGSALKLHRGRANRADTSSLTYRPRSGHAGTDKAAASSQQVLDRRIKLAGLDHNDTTASSISKWRINAVFMTQGPQAARAAYGVSDPARNDRVVNYISAHAPAASTRKPLVTTFTR